MCMYFGILLQHTARTIHTHFESVFYVFRKCILCTVYVFWRRSLCTVYVFWNVFCVHCMYFFTCVYLMRFGYTYRIHFLCVYSILCTVYVVRNVFSIKTYTEYTVEWLCVLFSKYTFRKCIMFTQSTHSQSQIGWHTILRLFPKTFNSVPGFSWDLKNAKSSKCTKNTYTQQTKTIYYIFKKKK